MTQYWVIRHKTLFYEQCIIFSIRACPPPPPSWYILYQMEQERSIKIGWVQWGVRLSVAGLFGMALAGKLVDPSRFLTPLQGGLGLSGSGFRVRAFGFGCWGVLCHDGADAWGIDRVVAVPSERAWVGAGLGWCFRGCSLLPVRRIRSCSTRIVIRGVADAGSRRPLAQRTS